MAHSAGLDHKLLLVEDMDDSVGQEDASDEPLVVSSDSNEDLSDLVCIIFYPNFRLHA